MSPGNNVYIIYKERKWNIIVKGLDHIDMMDAADDLNIKRSDNKLQSVAQSQLHDQNLLKLKTSSWKD